MERQNFCSCPNLDVTGLFRDVSYAGFISRFICNEKNVLGVCGGKCGDCEIPKADQALLLEKLKNLDGWEVKGMPDVSSVNNDFGSCWSVFMGSDKNFGKWECVLYLDFKKGSSFALNRRY
jgi:hypothetical protein